MRYELPLILEPQPEGEYTVTSPILPGLVTEGGRIKDSQDNVPDALAAILDAYQETGKALPPMVTVFEEF